MLSVYLWALCTYIKEVAIYLLGAANIGYCNKKLNIAERVITVLVGVMLVTPAIFVNIYVWKIAGIVIAVALYFLFRRGRE